jgi:LPS export ABC transporter permease LptG
MLRRSDRYVLRETTGPFVLALAGLVLFILLNIILSLSDLMVDRGVSMPMLLRLVLLKVPSLLVVAIPMSVLFATFLGLGRLVHDREVVALESLGIPLRRILLPLVVAAAGIAVADFAIYNWLVPTSESAYQDALRGVIFRQGVPRITSNAFFKGANDQFIYIRRYDESTGKIYDVHIYDTTGQLFPQTTSEAKAQLTFLTADQGTWSGDAWSLENAHAYGFDREGNLVFSAVVASLVLPVDQGIAELLSRSKTTSEMGIGELLSRVAQARANGQRPSEYVVEIHLKMALPLAAVIFVLLAGSLSLAFLPRSRAVGVVLGLLLVAVYQGVLWWTQTLGRRNAMDPALAAWLPDILFGAFGLLLFLRVDRLASRDVWSRVRAKIPFAILSLLGVFALSATVGGAVPVHIDSDELYVSDDATLLRATGNAGATFSDTSIHADSLDLQQVQSASWRLEASGRVELAVGGKLFVHSDTFVAEVDASAGAVLTRSAEAAGLDGSTSFTNSAGEETTLYFRADRGRLTFEDGRVTRIEVFGSELTTCACADVDLARQPYSLRADRLLLYPDRLLVAYGLTGRAGGVSVVWLPIFVQPLAEALEAPLFPAIGRSAERGWFAKWSLPVFVSEALYGSINIDVFTRHGEIGLGGVARYALGEQTGEVSVYHFPAKVGDSEARFTLRHTAALAPGWEGSGRLTFEQKGERDRLSYSFLIDGRTELGDVSLEAARELRTTSDGSTHLSERLPELTLDVAPLRLSVVRFGAVRVGPRLTAGLLREGLVGESMQEAFRVSALASVTADAFELGGFRIIPEASIRGSLYDGPHGRQTQTAIILSPSAKWEDVTLVWSSAWVAGSSPLDSDQSTAGHELRWTAERDGAIDVELSGSYSLSEGPGAVRATLAWHAVADWTLSGAFSPAEGQITELDLRSTWTSGLRTAVWRLPLDKTSRQFERSSLTLSSESPGATVSLRLDADLDPFALSGWALDTEIETLEGWGLTLGATYSASAPNVVRPEFGLFRDIADCLRVGVERASGETWFYISILAFPEAVLRYAPRTFEVEVGE